MMEADRASLLLKLDTVQKLKINPCYYIECIGILFPSYLVKVTFRGVNTSCSYLVIHEQKR